MALVWLRLLPLPLTTTLPPHLSPNLNADALVVARTLISYQIVRSLVMRLVLPRTAPPSRRQILTHALVPTVDPNTRLVWMGNHSFVTNWVPMYWTRSNFEKKRKLLTCLTPCRNLPLNPLPPTQSLRVNHQQTLLRLRVHAKLNAKHWTVFVPCF